jgi:tetratricopeptide (TPR) repeat protein
VHPDVELCRGEGWDGVYLGRVIACMTCGAEDDYALTSSALMTLGAEVLRAAAGEDCPGFHLTVAKLWDGTVVRRASQALAVLRAAAAEQPERAESWRRLGNFALRCGRPDEAETSYRRAIEVDDREVEAAHSLAEMLWQADRVAEALAFVAKTIERLPGCDSDPDLRLGMARSAIEMLRTGLELSPQPLALMACWSRGTAGRDPVVSVSSVDLRRLADAAWDRLGEFLGEETVVAARLTTDVPDPREESQLAELLARRTHAQRAWVRPYLPSPPGKNRPCPCGSGKKRKMCCDRTGSAVPAR